MEDNPENGLKMKITNLLIDLGWDIISLGIVPTPTVQLITESSKASAGIVITASHNPADWNGLKFINNGGTFSIKAK